MDIPQQNKDKRIDIALDYCEIIIMLFLLIEEQKYERAECIAYLAERLKVRAERETDVDDLAYINEWSQSEAEKIVAETYKQLEESGEDEDIALEEEAESASSKESEKDTLKFEEYNVEIPKKDFPLSNFRATMLSIQLATTVMNFDEYLQAIKDGKTRKVWITENDDVVRKTHQEVDGLDIPINNYFNVGNSLLLFPGDSVNGAELKELINCRCWLECY